MRGTGRGRSEQAMKAWAADLRLNAFNDEDAEDGPNVATDSRPSTYSKNIGGA